jgi:hypothetical protein
VAGIGGPALSAAVGSGAKAISSFVQGATVPGSTSGSSPSASTAAGSENPLGLGGGDDSWAMLQAQGKMNEESREFNMQYLQLQENMQRESREYQTLSNVMKVRHDSAKAAINNIH